MTCSRVSVDELTWIWLPTVCTASGSTPVADVTTWATSVVEIVVAGVGLELQGRAAGEIDAELEAAEDDQQDRDDHQHRRRPRSRSCGGPGC